MYDSKRKSGWILILMFCVYVCNTRVCAYMHTCKHMNVCVWGGMCMYLHVSVCAHFMCVCVLSVPVYLHACLHSPTDLSSGCIYIHCHQLVLLGSLSQDILSFFNIYQSSLLPVLLHHWEQLWIVRIGDPWHYVF